VANAHITRETDGAATPPPKRNKAANRIFADAERVLFPKDDSGLPGRAEPKPQPAPRQVVSADVKLERL